MLLTRKHSEDFQKDTSQRLEWFAQAISNLCIEKKTPLVIITGGNVQSNIFFNIPLFIDIVWEIYPYLPSYLVHNKHSIIGIFIRVNLRFFSTHNNQINKFF